MTRGEVSFQVWDQARNQVWNQVAEHAYEQR